MALKCGWLVGCLVGSFHFHSCSFAGSPDILICGNCREMFSDLVDMIEHKRLYCKLRFTCKCDMTADEGDCGGSGGHVNGTDHEHKGE